MLNLLIQMFCLSFKLTHISSCYWSVFLDSCYFIFHKRSFLMKSSEENCSYCQYLVFPLSAYSFLGLICYVV